MTVFVDPMMTCLPNKNWKWNEACHLYATTEEELHAFALRLGLKRSWFQDKKSLPHYDLTKGMRYRAIKLGARPVTHYHLVKYIRKRRNNGPS